MITLRALVSVVAVIGLLGAVVAANFSRDPDATALDWRIVPALAKEVQVETPSRRAVVQTVTAPGTVESVEEAQIGPQVIGRVVKVAVEEGDTVKTGDLLVKLDETDARARLDSVLARENSLKAMIAQAEADLEKARRDLEKARALAGRSAFSVTELADAKSAAAKSIAGLERCKQDLAECVAMKRSTQEDLQRTEIRAPIDGVVAGLNVEVGEVAISGMPNLPGATLMTIADLGRMRVRVEVDESDIALVRSGQTARIYLSGAPDRPISGVVDRIAPKGVKTGEVVSFQTLVNIPERRDDLYAGMTASVEVEVKRADDALGVPVQAVVHRKRKDLPDTEAVRAWSGRHTPSPGERALPLQAQYVKLVFTTDGATARAVPVETGISDEQNVEIVWGLKADERVVVGPFSALDALKDGDPVTLAAPSASASTKP